MTALRPALTALLLCLGAAACAPRQAPTAATPTPANDADRAALAQLRAEQAQEQKHLENFDDLDFNVYSGRKWEEFHRSHAANILVHYPDGHTTTGLDAHLAELKPQFVFAPDTRIKVHPVKVAQGNLTAVIGVMEGSFTQPMPIAGGKTLAPTGKAFKLDMATVGRWENGVMVEEWLFWDNQAFMKQIGLAK
ncbi:ester cyclase [Lysobacter sp. cf310]|uniref:ester cyclase n=1 Tax=Lysobacter sp. cf310 TaxID=1761790 RepID=UPI0008DED3AE|nr:ester cyclase [Lysobacter sp. cf310]SFK42336.1 SnoaL-like polyketide cyclase [Lysobacter sp. cf310]